MELDEFLAIATGTDETGMPRAAITMCLFDEDEIVDSVNFESTINFLTAFGMALVIESEFEEATCLKSISSMARNWTENMKDIEYRKRYELHVIVTPLAFEGGILMDLKDLMYANLHKSGTAWRLILVFTIDGDSINFFAGEDIDIQEAARNVDFEIQRELKELDNEYAVLEEELNELENVNVYEQFVEENFKSFVEPEDKPAEPHDSWMRVSDE